MEISYLYHVGNEVIKVEYADNDKAMAQAAIDAAQDTAKLLERKRIIDLLIDELTEDWESDYYPGEEYCHECGNFDKLLPRLKQLIKGEE